MGTRNFGSYEKYLAFLAYGHATGVFKKKKGNLKIKIRGKPHKVKH